MTSMPVFSHQNILYCFSMSHLFLAAPCALTSFMANPVYTPDGGITVVDPQGPHPGAGEELRPGQSGAIIKVPTDPSGEASITVNLVDPSNPSGSLEVFQIHVSSTTYHFSIDWCSSLSSTAKFTLFLFLIC